MSIFWSLVNVSKGQQFTLILCVLSLIVQWSCHCSGETTETNFISHTSDMNSVTDNSTEAMNATTSNGTSSPMIISRRNVIASTVPPTQHQMKSNDSPRQNGEKSKLPSTASKKSHPVVFATLLALGLVCAAGMLGVSYQKYKKSRTPPSRRLDEEADARDHDSVHFSAASEGQSDKLKQNGEAQEKGKIGKDAASAEAAEKPAKKGKEEGDTEL